MKTFQVLVMLAALCICQSANSQTPSDIQVLQATYGAGNQQIDVTTKVQSLVQSGQTNVRIGTHLFGKDPIFGLSKSLHVLFTSNGVHYDTKIREGGHLSFSNAHQLNVAPPAPATPIPPASTVQEAAPSPPPPPEQRSMRWRCKDCRYMKHFTRPAPLEAAGKCPRCRGISFQAIG